MKDTHRLGIAHAKKYGGIFWTQIVHCHVVIVSNPQLVAEVLDRTKTPHTIDKPTEPQFYRMLDEVGIQPCCLAKAPPLPTGICCYIWFLYQAGQQATQCSRMVEIGKHQDLGREVVSSL